MNRKAKKRALRIHLALMYTLMTLVILILVTGLYFVIQGYRFNRFDGKIEQGGLVQFNSYPSGADVWLDGNRLANKTQSKLTISTGSHKASMWKEGYNDWNKNVMVRAGNVLWLDYIRLVPKDLQVKPVAVFNGAQSSKVSYDNKRLAIIEDAAQPNIALVNLGADTPQKKGITLASDKFTAPAAGEQQIFTLVSWAFDNRYLLVKHQYGDHHEWLSVDTANTTTVKNITTLLGVDATDVQYSRDDANTLFVLTANGEVKKANADQKSLSGPLLSSIESFTMYDANTVVYTAKADPATNVRSAGYLTVGAAAPRVVYKAPAGDASSLTLRINKYYGKFYQVVIHGEKGLIFSGDLAASDARTPDPLILTDTFQIPGGAAAAGFSPDGHRFVYAQNSQRIVTYDLDLLTAHPYEFTAAANTINWVDQFHYAVVEGQVLRLYDFDGTNGHDILNNARQGEAALLPNGKYLYGFTAAQNGLELSRAVMIVN